MPRKKQLPTGLLNVPYKSVLLYRGYRIEKSIEPNSRTTWRFEHEKGTTVGSDLNRIFNMIDYFENQKFLAEIFSKKDSESVDKT